jgi:hypothetical protein
MVFAFAGDSTMTRFFGSIKKETAVAAVLLKTAVC